MRVYHAKEIEPEEERSRMSERAWVLVTCACYPGEWHLSRKVCFQTSSSFVTMIRWGRETDNYVTVDIEENRDVLEIKR